MLNLFLQVIQPVTTPVYFLCAWSLLGIFFWSVWMALQDGVARLKRLHQIPCSRCAYFTGDYRLKCTVHPCKALTEDALDCRDYAPTALPQRTRARCKRCSGA